MYSRLSVTPKPNPKPDARSPDPRHWTLQVGAAVPFAARIRLRVPAAANIILPLSGIRKDDERLQVALDSVFGQIIPAAVFSTVAVGAMERTALAFPGVN